MKSPLPDEAGTEGEEADDQGFEKAGVCAGAEYSKFSEDPKRCCVESRVMVMLAREQDYVCELSWSCCWSIGCWREKGLLIRCRILTRRRAKSVTQIKDKMMIP